MSPKLEKAVLDSEKALMMVNVLRDRLYFPDTEEDVPVLLECLSDILKILNQDIEDLTYDSQIVDVLSAVKAK